MFGALRHAFNHRDHDYHDRCVLDTIPDSRRHLRRRAILCVLSRAFDIYCALASLPSVSRTMRENRLRQSTPREKFPSPFICGRREPTTLVELRMRQFSARFARSRIGGKRSTTRP
ncbi:hypothetical protein C8Q74DRAFT_711401 [Fomes fomentarius]|nr:hypothetical protein C8Q74DRAFT_711401 [Fomes fomentarius]